MTRLLLPLRSLAVEEAGAPAARLAVCRCRRRSSVQWIMSKNQWWQKSRNSCNEGALYEGFALAVVAGVTKKREGTRLWATAFTVSSAHMLDTCAARQVSNKSCDCCNWCSSDRRLGGREIARHRFLRCRFCFCCFFGGDDVLFAWCSPGSSSRLFVESKKSITTA